MRAFTTATGILRRKQPLSRFGQNSVSARISSRGCKSIQIGVHRPGQVERAIEHAAGAEALPRQRLAGARGGGDEQANTRERRSPVSLTSRLTASTSPTETAWSQITGGPCCARASWPARRNLAQPFLQPFAVFAGGGDLPQPPGRLAARRPASSARL